MFDWCFLLSINKVSIQSVICFAFKHFYSIFFSFRSPPWNFSHLLCMPDCCRKSAVAWLVASNTCWAHFGFHHWANAYGTSPDDGMPSVSVRLLQSIGIFQKPSFKGMSVLCVMFPVVMYVMVTIIGITVDF